MKYRTDFVTNSSSTSFAAAGASALLSLLISLLSCCSDAGEDGEDVVDGEDKDLDVYMQKSVMPEGTKKLVGGSSEPVWLYAQLLQQTEKGDIVITDATSSIQFEVSGTNGWVAKGEESDLGDWRVVDIYAVTPENGQNPPKNVVVKAKVKHGKKTYSTKFRFDYEAEPSLKVKPDKANFLTKTGEESEHKVAIINPGPEKWDISMEMDSFAEKICTASLEDVSDDGDKATLKIVEADTVETSGRSGEHYDKGRITIKAVQGDKELTDYTDVYVWREGLYLLNDTLDIDRETGAIVVKADTAEDGSMKVSKFDLRFLGWNSEEKKLVSDTSVFTEELFQIEDPVGATDEAESMLASCNLKLEYTKENRPSNMPSAIFSAQMDKVIPGKRGESFKVTANASVDDGVNLYEVNIPFIIKPAYLSEGREAWQKEYEYCKKIINEFMPEEARAKKLKELEDNKHYMGAEDLKTYRKECWSIAQDAIFKEQKSYLEIAAWNDKVVYSLEWTAWVGDRCLALALGVLTGPVGGYVATQLKEGFVDFIVKLQEIKSTDSWMDFASGFAFSRLQGVVGGGIDTKVTDDPKLALAWVSAFYTYKFAWHWAFDTDDAGNRKGAFEAIKAAGWDITALGLEKGLESFVKSYAGKNGYAQNEKVDEYAKKTVEWVKQTIASFNE